MQKRKYLLILLAILLISVFSGYSVAAVGKKTSHTYVAWIEEKCDPSPAASIYFLQVKNLDTGKTESVVTRTSPSRLLDVGISGNFVVWIEEKVDPSPAASIYFLKVKNLATGEMKTVSTKTSPNALLKTDVSNIKLKLK